jgi:hypothetical protein
MILKLGFDLGKLVELRRFEPQTSCMPCKSGNLPASGITGLHLVI